jgi:hypothetical protein
VSKLELEPPRKVVLDALRKPSFEVCGERREFSFLMGGLIVSTTPISGSSY